MMVIDRNRNMKELLAEYPELCVALERRGIECASCLAAQVDTLSDVGRMYKLDLDALLAEVEESVRNQAE
ncbi:DUF1858 domain-containing protein [Magnetofaba australis]|uniref:DUF1858 domain-containing protein n=1 Tax=Magnetofaba australis IT-1 TaxID=1434232 RepID=A0A1Y2K4R2_9PROT|nr:DUF1858 domain-containing protein [Magnetofaba australis]OSM04249.1 hypothetical protein MAIT1_04117 [Magnetofaba australis IT-1]